MSLLAIITARGGSKRIPRKNVKPFMGRPMLAYALAAARECALFDEIMVSTDDDEIAALARAEGAAVPFRRSAATSGDLATTDAVLREVLDAYAARGRSFDAFCCLYPCVPLLTGALLHEAGARQGLDLTDGVYVLSCGPAFETPAEIRAYGILGADVVGMSTVPEAMVASACGLRVAGLSFVSNMAAGVTGQLLDGNDVVDCATRHSDRLARLVLDFLDLAAPSR